MGSEDEGLIFNLLDTPGHQDSSEDTHGILTAIETHREDRDRFDRFIAMLTTQKLPYSHRIVRSLWTASRIGRGRVCLSEWPGQRMDLPAHHFNQPGNFCCRFAADAATSNNRFNL
jgi:hypothetical protein